MNIYEKIVKFLSNDKINWLPKSKREAVMAIRMACEKEVAEKVADAGNGCVYCPVCRRAVEHYRNYCGICGKHLDWSGYRD